MSSRFPYMGPPLLSHGFRLFFLVAALFAGASVPAWIMIRDGLMEIRGPFLPADWHIHEMIFGYGAAVLAGFLFTAIPNWTGRMPIRGWPLAALALIWLAGRLSVAGLIPLPPAGIMAVDGTFLLAVSLMAVREIVSGRNWRNMLVIGPVFVLLAANLVFHLEAMWNGSADLGRRLGLGVIVFLILLIGGRITPSFTRNWLVQRGENRLPTQVNRFDGICLALTAVALLSWAAAPAKAAGTALIVAGLLQAVRLARWRGFATWRSPLLLMLHAAFAFVPCGLVATGLACWDVLPAAAGLHLLGVGGIGGMTLAVMMRATLGHTGRDLNAGPWLVAAFLGIALAAVLRSALPDAMVFGVTGLELAAASWTLAFGLFIVRAGPWLIGPQAASRKARAVPTPP
ncbi:NnrS family protein [Rubellimicrobium arenae]|uniref:NnrS family protein n=1 Tax=Rubellimicrobium arenae TaxID=2817372 RepID=UPI001B3005CA|nr:NnrS family protein [Rubellimicrobium arenae]